MPQNTPHLSKKPITKSSGKKRPPQDPAKPFANRKHNARKLTKPFGERKKGEAGARPSADKSSFKKDVRKSAKPATGFGDKKAFGDKPSFRDKPYFQKEQKESDKLGYGHPAKGDKKYKPARPLKPFAPKKPTIRKHAARSR